MLPVIGAVVSLAGSVLLLIAALGLLRMPDLYNRMQAGTKASTLGIMLVLIGIGIAQPGWVGKIVPVLLFLVFTNPVSSHALARAAHWKGIPLAPDSVKDDLENDNDN